jgi:hypothetical protein
LTGWLARLLGEAQTKEPASCDDGELVVLWRDRFTGHSGLDFHDSKAVRYRLVLVL